MPLWHQTPKARRILAKLTAEDVALKVVTPIWGDRHYAWTATIYHDALKAIRTAAVDAAFGSSFADAADKRAYIEFDRTVPTVEAALELLFGPACAFGSPVVGQSFGPCVGAHVADVLAGRLAA